MSDSAGTDGTTGGMEDDDAADSSTTYIEPGCGNGRVEDGEQCDEGDDNSNSTPDACREDCSLPSCRDRVVDEGEECDEGNDNSDFEPNTCRYDCVLPTCGDGVHDDFEDELCDDGNDEFGDSCFRCRNRYYFILNSPDLTSGGTMSILRTIRDGPPDVLIGDDASLNGMYQIAIGRGGRDLWGLRSDGGTHEVVLFNTTSGEVRSRIDLAAGLGYDPTPRGMVLASDGNLYVGLNAMGSTRLARVNTDNENVTEHVDFAAQFTIVDMTADNANGVYISTGAGGSIEYADVGSMAISTFADGGDGLANPQGIAFDADTDVFWVIDHAGGAPNVFNADLAGTFMPFTTALEAVGANSPALMIDVGGVVTTTATDQNRVVGIALLGEVQTLFEDMVTAPFDIEKIELD